MANTSFFPPILNDNIQIPQKIIHADQTETITSISDFTSLLDGPGRYFIETSSTSRPTLLSIGLIPVNTYGVLEAIRLDEGEYNYYLNYRGENNKRWFATMIMGFCSTWQEVAIKSDLDALSGNLNTKYIYELQQIDSPSGFDGSQKETTINITMKSGYTPHVYSVGSNNYNSAHFVQHFSQPNSNGAMFIEHNLNSNATVIRVYIVWEKT